GARMTPGVPGWGGGGVGGGGGTLGRGSGSVTPRHFDARIRLPRLLTNLEPDVRARLQARLARGKVDLTVTAPEGGAPAPRLEVDLAAAREYLAAGPAPAPPAGGRGGAAAAPPPGPPGARRLVPPRPGAAARRR